MLYFNHLQGVVTAIFFETKCPFKGKISPPHHLFLIQKVMRTFGWSPSDLELQVKNIFSPFLNGEEKQPLNLVFQELIGEIDQDGNGSISFNEFVWLMTR